MSNKQIFQTTWGGRPLTIEVGQMAKQANGAVLVRYGDTAVLSAAVASKKNIWNGFLSFNRTLY